MTRHLKVQDAFGGQGQISQAEIEQVIYIKSRKTTKEAWSSIVKGCPRVWTFSSHHENMPLDCDIPE